MRLLTWNLGRIHVPRLPGDSRASDRDLPTVARVLRRLDVDAAALEELSGRRQLEALLEALGPSWTGVLGEPERFDRHVAIVARRRLAPRLAPVATSTGRAGALLRAGPWALLALHADAFDARRRRRQIEEALDAAEVVDAPHVLVAGDLNVDVDRRLLRRGDDGALARRLHAGWADLGRLAGATALLGRRLDYLLARRRAGAPCEGLPAIDSVWVERARLPFGDHRPLVAALAPAVAVVAAPAARAREGATR